MTEPGRFITVEGGEGVGKSSSIEYLREFLAARGIKVHVTREPGGTALAEAIRGLLKNPDMQVDAKAELLLIFAARASHLEEVVRPRLAAGEWVLCDRFTDATHVYQGLGRGLGTEPVAWLEDWVQGALRPDLTLLLDAPVDVGFQRADRRGARDRFEQEALDFFEQVRSGYLERARLDPDRIRVIDAAREPEQVQFSIEAVLASWLQQLRKDPASGSP